jgi:hypothetical protein
MIASRRRLARLLPTLGIALLAVTACGEGTVGPVDPPPDGTPLTPGNWFMHTANGNALPAEIARRFIGVVDEQTMLDSAILSVAPNGSWSQRYYTRVLHAGALDRADVVIDEGNWTAGTTNTAFTSTLRTRTFTVAANTASQATSDEPMVFFPNATNVTGVYRTSPP